MDTAYRYALVGPMIILLAQVVWLPVCLVRLVWWEPWQALHGFIYHLLWTYGPWQLAHWWSLTVVHLPVGASLTIAGAIVGWVSPRHWLGDCLVLLAGCYIVPIYMLWLTPEHLTDGVPYHLAGAALALIAAGLVKSVRPRPYPPGHCQGCGYPVHNLTSETCPECGGPDTTPTAP